MSVINQMLKDLGTRQSRSELRLADMLDRQVHSMRLRRKYLPAAGPALMILAGVLVMGALLWQQLQRGEPQTSATPAAARGAIVSAAAVPATPAVQTAASGSVAGAVIGAIGIEADSASLRLVFESDRAPARAVTQVLNADGSIDYTFANARIEAALPVLAENPFIKSYTVTQRGADVVLRMVPAASTLAFLEPAATDGGYRTVIGARIQNAGIAAAPADKPASPGIQKTAQPRKQRTVARSAPVEVGSTNGQGAEKIEITRSVTPARQAETWYRQGLEKLQADRVEAAVSDLRKAVSLQPGLHAARELLAALLLRSGHSAEAHAELRQGMRLDPAYTAYARLYAQSLLEAGDPAGALQVLAVSEPYAVQQPDYRALMAAVAQRLARHEESIRHYMAALDMKPARSAWWVGMAISLEALGRAQEAAQAYRTALAGTELNADLTDYARTRAAQLGRTSRGG